MKSVLLTVSGRMLPDLEEQVAQHRRPRADYTVMSDAFDADLVDVDGALVAMGRFGRLIHRVAGVGPLLAVYCFRNRKQYQVIVTDGEQVGLPLALLCRILGKGSAKHMMIVHVLSTPAKVRLVKYAGLAGLVDTYVAYCTWQRDFIQEVLHVPEDRVVLSTFMVDTTFFDPRWIEEPQQRMICSVGLERRDYETLVESVRGLDVRLVIAAASPWSRRPDATTTPALPPNVEVQKLSLPQLRTLYGRSRFVVMPLQQVEFQAGITTILEAMSMARAVVCTLTPGQTDTVIDGRTGRYVPASDSSALRETIVSLLEDDASTQEMGETARRWVVDHADIEKYARRLAAEVDRLRNELDG